MNVRKKIMLAGIAMVVVTAVTLFAVVVVQQWAMRQNLDDLVRSQSVSEAVQVSRNVHVSCVAILTETEEKLARNLKFARQMFNRAGSVSFGAENVSWSADNQVTGEKKTVELPKFLLGGVWLGQNLSTNTSSPVVDEVRTVTGDYVTIFQRMNEQGDMLRVCTSVLNADGSRAMGSYIPHQNGDGSDNPVIKAILKGKTYFGRAYVVNEWHMAAYEPIWDESKKTVVGMIYVGVAMSDISRGLREGISKMAVGKSGYVYVLGAKGDQRGRYVVSQNNARNGENIWESKDASGRYFIQSIVDKALKGKPGDVNYESYSWKNSGDSGLRKKVAVFTYYEPWDWIIAASVYEDDLSAYQAVTRQALSGLTRWFLIGMGVVLILALACSYLVAQGIARPIAHSVEALGATIRQLALSSGEMSRAHESLSEGASEQAASIEETSASLEEISSMTKNNSDNAQRAKDLADQAQRAAEVGALDMREMSEAMKAIKDSSNNIAAIIKTIDEIAFQTNILALNAAVEAARAGDAGLGFAVVAAEVRSLAQRSADAARETAQRIEDSIQKGERAGQINAKVAASLKDIVDKACKVDELVAGIASASKEQAQGIVQVTSAVAHVDKVIQTDAASAEETADAARSLEANAELLRHTVEELRALLDGANAEAPRNSKTKISLEIKPAKPAPPPCATAHSNGAKRLRASDDTDIFGKDT